MNSNDGDRWDCIISMGCSPHESWLSEGSDVFETTKLHLSAISSRQRAVDIVDFFKQRKEQQKLILMEKIHNSVLLKSAQTGTTKLCFVLPYCAECLQLWGGCIFEYLDLSKAEAVPGYRSAKKGEQITAKMSKFFRERNRSRLLSQWITSGTWLMVTGSRIPQKISVWSYRTVRSFCTASRYF